MRNLPRLNGKGHTLIGQVGPRIGNREPGHLAERERLHLQPAQEGFEQVNAYYAVDAEQNYLQRLGFTDVNAEQQKIAHQRVHRSTTPTTAPAPTRSRWAAAASTTPRTPR